MSPKYFSAPISWSVNLASSCIFPVIFRYLLSGFELELYSVHEYPYIFWYLYELLFPWLTTCLHRADTYLIEHEQLLLDSQQKTSGEKERKRNCQLFVSLLSMWCCRQGQKIMYVIEIVCQVIQKHLKLVIFHSFFHSVRQKQEEIERRPWK